MGYFFRIYFKDKSCASARAIGNTEKDLIGYDQYSTTEYYEKFLTNVVSKLNKKRKDINYVKIGYTKDVVLTKDSEVIEYSLINENPYMKDIFKYIEPKQVYMYGLDNYESKRTVISNTSPNYEEMIDYIFTKLDKNSKELLDKVLEYKDDNDKIKLALHQYSNFYVESLSDENARKELKTKIKEELTDYTKFRGMAVARYSYELRKKKEEMKNFKESLKQLDKKYEEMSSIENKIADYRSRHEDEFVPETEEEYNLMADGPDGKVL